MAQKLRETEGQEDDECGVRDGMRRRERTIMT